MKEIIEKVLESRAWEYGVISTADLAFSGELRRACEVNTCGNYNKCWTCPPAVGTLDEQIKKISAFGRAFVFTTKYDLEDSFDYEGMMKAKEIHDILTREMHEKFGKTNPVFGAGGCTVCKTCAYPDPCRFPEKAYSSVEAAGVNVTNLSRAANVKYNNGPNTVTYFSMILFNGQD
jgi:predicted metal-binding protein